MRYLTQYSMVNQVMKMASAMAKSRCSLVSLVSGSVTLKFFIMFTALCIFFNFLVVEKLKFQFLLERQGLC